MRFRLTPRLMTLDDLQLLKVRIFGEFLGILQSWETTTARLFLNRFQTHVCQCRNFSPVQSAYRRNYSTETVLLHTLDKVYTSADQGKPTLLVSLDFSAAFDTIDHSTTT